MDRSAVGGKRACLQPDLPDDGTLEALVRTKVAEAQLVCLGGAVRPLAAAAGSTRQHLADKAASGAPHSVAAASTSAAPSVASTPTSSPLQLRLPISFQGTCPVFVGASHETMANIYETFHETIT